MSLMPPLDIKLIKSLSGKLPNDWETRFRDKRHEITVVMPSDKSALNGADDKPLSIEEFFPNSHPGSRLRGLRTREGATQKSMAEELNIPPRHISEMESDKRPISVEMAKRISKTSTFRTRAFYELTFHFSA